MKIGKYQFREASRGNCTRLCSRSRRWRRHRSPLCSRKTLRHHGDPLRSPVLWWRLEPQTVNSDHCVAPMMSINILPTDLSILWRIRDKVRINAKKRRKIKLLKNTSQNISTIFTHEGFPWTGNDEGIYTKFERRQQKGYREVPTQGPSHLSLRTFVCGRAPVGWHCSLGGRGSTQAADFHFLRLRWITKVTVRLVCSLK